jgi:hypothetical protein
MLIRSIQLLRRWLAINTQVLSPSYYAKYSILQSILQCRLFRSLFKHLILLPASRTYAGFTFSLFSTLLRVNALL